jgi:hypothetical protein
MLHILLFFLQIFCIHMFSSCQSFRRPAATKTPAAAALAATRAAAVSAAAGVGPARSSPATWQPHTKFTRRGARSRRCRFSSNLGRTQNIRTQCCNARAPTSPRSIGFCVIWESISSSSFESSCGGSGYLRQSGAREPLVEPKGARDEGQGHLEPQSVGEGGPLPEGRHHGAEAGVARRHVEP